MEDIYTRLAKQLDKLPIPYPATESGIERQILARWFSPRGTSWICSLRLPVKEG